MVRQSDHVTAIELPLPAAETRVDVRGASDDDERWGAS